MSYITVKYKIPAKTTKLGKQFAGKCKKLGNLKIKSKKLTYKTVSAGAFKNLPVFIFF